MAVLIRATNPLARGRTFSRKFRLIGKAIALMAFFILTMGSNRGFPAEPSFTEYQVKAGFLFNFVKYVAWPPEAFTEVATPITIGIVGKDKFGEDLRKAVEGKSFADRKIVVRQFANDSDFSKCHILFVSASEKKHLGEILDKIKTLPVLTVGEAEGFLESGGIIKFTKKQDKIRLEIDLNAARHAQLQISSKLLAVADVVRGKH